MSGTCLGDVAAALVDGELDHAARERALRHLAHCTACRAEVDGQRRLKARLAAARHAEAPSGLTDRLLRLPSPLPGPATGSVRPPTHPAAARAAPTRPAGSHPRTAGARPRRAVRGRATAGSAFALLGVAAALALGAPPSRPATTPADPATGAVVAKLVGPTAHGPSAAAVPVPAARPAGPTTFVPLTRTALLSTGGARTTR